MKRTAILLALLAILAAALPAQAGPPASPLVTPEEALTVATNWVALVLHYEGTWGDSDTAGVAEVRDFKRGDRLLGYFCRVEPQGYVIVSPRREMHPIKAYSDTSDLTPDADEGMAGMLKFALERTLNLIEGKHDAWPLSAPTETSFSIVENEDNPGWEELTVGVEDFGRNLRAGVTATDYAYSTWMLTSNWHQSDPYNRWCPQMVGSEACAHALVGCVATAAAQIMRYWSWPPYGVGGYDDWYDWPNMPDSVSASSPQVQIDAVAELCMEVGHAAAMDYGCSSSTAWLGSKPGKDMTEAYQQDFRYNEDTDFEQRWHHSDDGWFDIVTTNLNANQPLQYGFLDLSVGDGFAAHSTVLDGWKTVGSTRMVHMNYGWWDTGTDTWYNLNDLPGGSEGFIRKIRPKPSLGQTVSGWYSPPSFPYRYFNRDATGSDAHFDAGHYLQFLPGIKVVCTGTLIEFRGWSNANTYLYTTASWAQGIRIHSGHIYLYQTGGLRLH